MKLFICEKPSQAKDLATVIGANSRGDGFLATADKANVITWGFGHLVEQFQPDDYDANLKRWTFDTLPIIPKQWKVAPKKEGKKQYNIVISLLKKARHVIISTDADREGEMIARELIEIAGYRGPIQRCWLSALDPESIRTALRSLKPGEETFRLYHAALARSRADWLIGMNFSRLFTLLAQSKGYSGKPLSVGRVQSPTLGLVVQRDQEIKNFVPKPHYALVVALIDHEGKAFNATYQVPETFLDKDGLCLDSRVVEQAAQQIQQVSVAQVMSVETKREKNAPPLLYALSDLQGECNRLFGMGAQKVLDVAQSLYEVHKITTYPRTDCGYLPTSQLEAAPKIIQGLLNADPRLQSLKPHLNLAQRSRAWNDKQVTAHHGIIPTTKLADLSKLSSEEMQVFDLIRRRYLAQFLPHFEVDKTAAVLKAGEHTLVSKGNVIVAQGWKVLFKQAGNEEANENEENQKLPVLQVNQKCAVQNTNVRSLKTTPPSHYTEGTLLSAMKNAARFVTNQELKQRLRETEGLGTEATRAGIIQGLIDKGFLVKKKKALLASAEAFALINSLPTSLKDPGLTALWEQALNQIAEGSMSLNDFMHRQEDFVRHLMKNCMQQGMQMGNIEIKKCPKCGSPMAKRTGKNGQFWGCTKYPTCDGIENIGKKTSKTGTAKRKNTGFSVSEFVRGAVLS